MKVEELEIGNDVTKEMGGSKRKSMEPASASEEGEGGKKIKLSSPGVEDQVKEKVVEGEAEV